jgi:pyruvate dehydrogenase (quinone)
VLHNNDLNQVTWEMRALSGSPKFAESQSLPEVSYAALATGIGLAGITVDQVGDLGRAWDQALTCGRPAVLDVRVDANFPPIPPHATLEQVRAVTGSLLKGDEDRRGVLAAGIRTKVQEFLPHRGRD